MLPKLQLWSLLSQPFSISFKPGDGVEELELEGATVLVNVLLEMKQFTKVGTGRLGARKSYFISECTYHDWALKPSGHLSGFQAELLCRKIMEQREMRAASSSTGSSSAAMVENLLQVSLIRISLGWKGLGLMERVISPQLLEM